MSLREWFMRSLACLGINRMIQCAIYNFLVIDVENIKANKIFCSVSLFLICVWDVKNCSCLVDGTCLYEPLNTEVHENLHPSGTCCMEIVF